MSTSSLVELSNQIADIVAAVAPSVVQVQGGARPASGVVYAPDVILTTIRALGREDGLHIRTLEGAQADAELTGWDPATGLAIIKGTGLKLQPVATSDTPARVGEVAIAIGRSWSNVATATMGIVAIVGGPLRTGRGRSIDQVIRTTAPMHGGFAGGAFVNAAGRVAGIATAATIRGLGVVIPTAIAWPTAASVLQHGRPKLGYLGLSGQPVRLDRRQRDVAGRPEAMLVLAVSPDGPADAAGVQVGDAIVTFDGQAVSSPDDLIGLLSGDRVGRTAPLRVIRGGSAVDLQVVVAERKSS
jgi:S1-C subfamily serine protease